MEQVEQYWVLGDRYTFHLNTPELAILEIESGHQHGPPPHSHRQEEETLFVLNGQLEVLQDGHIRAIGKGDFVHFLKGSLHTFRTVSTEGSRILVTISPGRFAQLFREIGVKSTEGGQALSLLPQAQAKLLSLSQSFGLDIDLPAASR